MTPQDAYARLEERFDRVNRVRESLQVLGWDRATMMPDGGVEARKGQMSALERHARELVRAPEVGDWLGEAEEAAGDALGPWQRANLREMRRERQSKTAVPLELAEAWLEQGVECRSVWRQARHDDDFDRLKPHLAEVIELTRRLGDARADALDLSRYDALVDRYAPGLTGQKIDEVFGNLADELPTIIDEAIEAQRQAPDPNWPDAPMPPDAQHALAESLMGVMGFDFEHGRLDTSPHGFCGGHPQDVRITTRWDREDFREGIYCVLHETGHAMYTRQLPDDWFRQPIGRARGMVVHESQSLLVEQFAGRTRAFCEFAAPLFDEHFDGQPDGVFQPDNLHRMVNRVDRGLIRVEADAVTYPAHVLLRYDIERDLLSGDLSLDDLPAAWDEAMEEYLGITPPDDCDGCMQDIHWMDGSFGYFPTYLLGQMTAAQLFATADEELDGLRDDLADGDFEGLMEWLAEKVHRLGSRHDADALLEEATGAPLSSRPLVEHLRGRGASG